MPLRVYLIVWNRLLTVDTRRMFNTLTIKHITVQSCMIHGIVCRAADSSNRLRGLCFLQDYLELFRAIRRWEEGLYVEEKGRLSYREGCKGGGGWRGENKNRPNRDRLERIAGPSLPWEKEKERGEYLRKTCARERKKQKVEALLRFLAASGIAKINKLYSLDR